MNKQKIAMIGMIAALVVLSQYIIIEKWNEAKQKEQSQIYHNGYNQGLRDAVSTIFYNTRDCNMTPLTLGNLTKYFLDVSCLNSTRK